MCLPVKLAERETVQSHKCSSCYTSHYFIYSLCQLLHLSLFPSPFGPLHMCLLSSFVTFTTPCYFCYFHLKKFWELKLRVRMTVIKSKEDGDYGNIIKGKTTSPWQLQAAYSILGMLLDLLRWNAYVFHLFSRLYRLYPKVFRNIYFSLSELVYSIYFEFIFIFLFI